MLSPHQPGLQFDISPDEVKGGKAGHRVEKWHFISWGKPRCPYSSSPYQEEAGAGRPVRDAGCPQAVGVRRLPAHLNPYVSPTSSFSRPSLPTLSGGPQSPSFRDVHSPGWSQPVFMGLISLVKLLSSPESSGHLGAIPVGTA